MSWRDHLRPASFLGDLFFIVDSGGTAGRLMRVHEYLKRDMPMAEDMGRATREFTIESLVVSCPTTCRWVQPRACGEWMAATAYEVPPDGSAPRVRGMEPIDARQC